mgnify:CR=1 FL=1|tara:strand:- start:717 stop:1025 length:309 start_codon:yes stop_codon:yes gene_type:complete
MTKEKLDQLLAAGAITKLQYDEMIGDIVRREAEQDELDKTQAWFKKYEKANLTTKKRMGAELTANLFMKGALTSDRQEKKQIEGNAYDIRSATRRVGGFINI